MTQSLTKVIERYREEYLETPEGQKHLAIMEAEARAVKKEFADIRVKHREGKDITDDVLNRLLPTPTQSSIAKTTTVLAHGLA